MPVLLVVVSENDLCCPQGIQPLQAAHVWAGNGNLCYSFKDHRPLIGQEDLLARCGFLISRLNASPEAHKLLPAAYQRLPSRL